MLKKIAIAITLLGVGLVSGWELNEHYGKSCEGKNHSKKPSFPVDEMMIGEAMAPEEQRLYESILQHNQKFIASLSKKEQSLIESIIADVKSLVSKDPNVSISAKELADTHEKKLLVKKIRQHRKSSALVATKEHKKTFRSIMQKLPVEQRIELLMGIR